MSDMREEFEREYSDNGKWPAAVERVASGAYRLAHIHAAWQAWQAAWQAARAQSGQGAESEGFDFDGWYDKHQSLFREGAGKSDLRAAYKQGYRDSHPQSAHQGGVPEGITVEMLESIWQDGFDAESIDDRDYCDSLIIARIAVEDAPQPPKQEGGQ